MHSHHRLNPRGWYGRAKHVMQCVKRETNAVARVSTKHKRIDAKALEGHALAQRTQGARLHLRLKGLASHERLLCKVGNQDANRVPFVLAHPFRTTLTGLSSRRHLRRTSAVHRPRPDRRPR